MENGTVARVGVVFTDDGEVVNLVATKSVYGSYELFYNNDPFGIVSVMGYSDLDIQEANEEQLKNLTDLLLHNNSEKYQGVFLLKEHLAFIKHTEDFDTVIVPKRVGSSEPREYDEYLDVGLVEGEEIDYYDEVMYLLNGYSF